MPELPEVETIARALSPVLTEHVKRLRQRPDLNFVPNPAGYVWCAIKDSGVGIHAEDQAELFQKFFRSGDQAVRDQPGTGLGLSITKSLIELQKGAIWVESEGVPGQGSTFAFSIPIAEDDAPA